MIFEYNAPMQGERGAIEAALIGYPYVVIEIDKVERSVIVAEHCKGLGEAVSFVDDMTRDPAKVEYMIVRETQLIDTLIMQRQIMAKQLERE